MTDVAIVAAKRTAIGTFGGVYSNASADSLGVTAISAIMADANIQPGEPSELIFGQVLTAGQGQNPARQAAIRAGLPDSMPSYTINHVCGSGLKAVGLGAQSIKLGESGIVIAGGQENMTQSPHCMTLRAGVKMGDAQMVDTMIKDGLWDAFNGYHMGVTAENVAEKWQISREEQDAFAASSQNKAEAAQASGRFAAEIAAVTIKGRKGDTIVDTDEHPKHGTTADTPVSYTHLTLPTTPYV